MGSNTGCVGCREFQHRSIDGSIQKTDATSALFLVLLLVVTVLIAIVGIISGLCRGVGERCKVW